jgi:hypothetical protein
MYADRTHSMINMIVIYAISTGLVTRCVSQFSECIFVFIPDDVLVVHFSMFSLAAVVLVLSKLALYSLGRFS